MDLKYPRHSCCLPRESEASMIKHLLQALIFFTTEYLMAEPLIAGYHMTEHDCMCDKLREGGDQEGNV